MAHLPVSLELENMVADASGKTGKVAKAAYTVAEWSEGASWAFNAITLWATAFDLSPAAPGAWAVHGISGGLATGADIVATGGYATHYIITRDKSSSVRALGSFVSIPLDMVPMFKPGIVAKTVGGGWGFYKGAHIWHGGMERPMSLRRMPRSTSLGKRLVWGSRSSTILSGEFSDGRC